MLGKEIIIATLTIWSGIVCTSTIHKKYSDYTTIQTSNRKDVTVDNTKKRLFIIDGSSFLYRAYYSLKPLHTPQGEPIQAVYSFCRMLKKLIDSLNPQYMIVAWDSKGKTTRHTMYEEYKATRQAPPSDLFMQKNNIVEFLDNIKLKQVAREGVEADDLIYSLAIDFEKEGYHVVMVTSDKDMGQALSDNITMYDPFKDVMIDQLSFANKMGFPTEKLPFYFSLLGDSSDNIPGVRGIGEKTATEIVQQFASLDDLYARIHLINKARISNALLEQKDNAYLSLKLFLLQYIPLAITEKDVTFQKEDWSLAFDFFKKFNFKSFLSNAQTQTTHMSAEEKIIQLKKVDFVTVTNKTILNQLIADLKQTRICAIDTEGDALNPLTTNLVGISISMDGKRAYYIPCHHKTGEEQLPSQEIFKSLAPYLEDPTYKKYMHHAKFDLLVLRSHGYIINGLVFDTLIAASLLVKDWQRAGLKYLSEQYLNEEMLSFKDVVTDHKLPNFSYVPLEIATYYAANDARQTYRLVSLLEKQLHDEQMTRLYEKIEFPLVQILTDMEQAGIFIDVPLLQKISKELDHDLTLISDQIRGFLPEEQRNININSPRQVEIALFETLKLPPKKKSAKGSGYSTDQKVLSELAEIHPVPGLILKYRELFKLKSTYVDALPSYVNMHTGKIHTTYSQISVATGRLASSEPNLQNIPSSGYGLTIREAFKPDPGYCFLSADYSQIELRILAYLSQDKALKEAFLSGQDIHSQTAARLFDVAPELVSHEQRQIGKRINFSILYGLTPYGLSKDLGIPFKDAKIYIDRYFAQYPEVKQWMDNIVAKTEKDGYITTLWGRRRYIPGIYEKNHSLYEEAKRIAINTVAQGTASEIMKQGMIALHDFFKKESINAHIILQIHDELVIAVKQEDALIVKNHVKQILEHIVDWNIPLEVSTKIGNTWLEVSK